MKEKAETIKDLTKLIIKNPRIRTEVTKSSHLWFATVYLAEYFRYEFAQFHHDMFTLTENHETKMVVITAFRGCGKSTIMTLSYPLWAILGVQQKKYVVIIGQTEAQAKQYLNHIKRELERNELLRRDLGPFESWDEQWSAGGIVIPKYDARIVAISCEQNIRGQRHGRHRPDLIICDDLEDLASVKARDNRDKTYRWLTGDVIPAGDTDTKIIIIGNHLHEDGLMARLSNEINAGTREGRLGRYPLLDPLGKPMWPGKFPDQGSVEKLRHAVVDDAAWQREYLLRIVSEDEQVIQQEWIHRYEGEILRDKDIRFMAIGVDLAISDKDSADYTAMVCAYVRGYGKDLRIYILPNPINERLGFTDTIDRIVRLRSVINFSWEDKLYVEDVGYQLSVIQRLTELGIAAEGFNPRNTDKRGRLALTAHPIQKGIVLFPKNGTEALERQLVGFGTERHDDLADAFSILILKTMDMNHEMIDYTVRGLL